MVIILSYLEKLAQITVMWVSSRGTATELSSKSISWKSIQLAFLIALS